MQLFSLAIGAEGPQRGERRRYASLVAVEPPHRAGALGRGRRPGTASTRPAGSSWRLAWPARYWDLSDPERARTLRVVGARRRELRPDRDRRPSRVQEVRSMKPGRQGRAGHRRLPGHRAVDRADVHRRGRPRDADGPSGGRRSATRPASLPGSRVVRGQRRPARRTPRRRSPRASTASARIDILVNNAATNPYAGDVIDIDRPRAEKILQVNLLGPLTWSQLAWRTWMQAHGGVIVNIASTGAFARRAGDRVLRPLQGGPRSS